MKIFTTGRDKTGQPFSIIAGEKRKDVSITAENLHNKNVPCNGLLLPGGQKHDSPEHVFLSDRAYYTGTRVWYGTLRGQYYGGYRSGTTSKLQERISSGFGTRHQSMMT
jgi:hypothetical protein